MTSPVLLALCKYPKPCVPESTNVIHFSGRLWRRFLPRSSSQLVQLYLHMAWTKSVAVAL